MSLGLRQRREVAFVLAKAVTSLWSPSAHTGFHVHHQRAAVTSDQRRACVPVFGGRDHRSLSVFSAKLIWAEGDTDCLVLSGCSWTSKSASGGRAAWCVDRVLSWGVRVWSLSPSLVTYLLMKGRHKLAYLTGICCKDERRPWITIWTFTAFQTLGDNWEENGPQIPPSWNFPASEKDGYGTRYYKYMSDSSVSAGASLLVQWWRICLPMQGTRVRSLVWEDPTCCGNS